MLDYRTQQEKIDDNKKELFGFNYLEDVNDGYYIPEALDDVIIEAFTDEQYSILENIAVAIDNFNDYSTDKWYRGLRLLLSTLSWVKINQLEERNDDFILAVFITCEQIKRDAIQLEGLFMSHPELEKEYDSLVEFINDKLNR